MRSPSRLTPDEHDHAFAIADVRSGTAQLLDALGLIVNDPRRLGRWLRSLLNDDQTRRIAQQSYWHANGFAKLVLFSGPTCRVRLHLWPGGSEGETNPHGHRWDFASMVLAGRGLEIVEYEESDIGPVHIRHQYTPSAVTGGAVLRPIGAVQLRAISERTVAHGERYVTETRTVHTVKPVGSRLVATIVVQGPTRARSTLVYCPRGAAPQQKEHAMHTSDITMLVNELLTVLISDGETPQ